MKVTPGHIFLPVMSILVGLSLLCAGLWAGWGLVWASAGAFFIVFAIGAWMLVLAWVLPPPWGNLLRHPLFSIFWMVLIFGLMALTVLFGIFQ